MTVTSLLTPVARPEPSQVDLHAGTAWLALPFDALRAQYAGVVRAGFVERSLLASGHVERALAALEQFALGPWARRV
jgi:hypothetical protein